MYKRLLIAAALVVTAVSSTGMSTVSAESHEDELVKKIAYCHATGSETNPYVYLNTSVSAFYKAGHHEHQNHEDIVPAFSYMKKKEVIHFPGLNWTETNAAFVANKCAAVPPVKTEANIKHSIICDVAAKTATITLTNSGDKKGIVKVKAGTAPAEKITVKGQTTEAFTVAIPADGIQIKITFDNQVLFNELYKCEGGQGSGEEPETPVTPTTPATPDSTATPAAGQGATPADETAVIASLPYTAGNNTQMIAVIISAIAAVAAIVSTIVKKAYLKQI